MKIILGIDPSLSCTGWAIKQGNQILSAGKIITTNSNRTENQRIYSIACSLLDECIKWKATIAIMESQFMGPNARTALQLSRLRGAIMFALSGHYINTIYVEPTTVKMTIAGKGNATKEEVYSMITLLYSNSDIVKDIGPFNDKNCKAKTSDIYDAIAIATTYKE